MHCHTKISTGYNRKTKKKILPIGKDVVEVAFFQISLWFFHQISHDPTLFLGRVRQATGPVFHHKTRIRNRHDQSQNLQIEKIGWRSQIQNQINDQIRAPLTQNLSIKIPNLGIYTKAQVLIQKGACNLRNWTNLSLEELVGERDPRPRKK